MTKDALCSGVGKLNRAVVVHADNSVTGSFDNDAISLFTVAACELLPLTIIDVFARDQRTQGRSAILRQ